MSNRRELLEEYLREVVRDLCTRGIVRKHQGWNLVEYLQSEPAAVFGSIISDLNEAGVSVKNEVVHAAKQTILTTLGHFFNNVRR